MCLGRGLGSGSARRGVDAALLGRASALFAQVAIHRGLGQGGRLWDPAGHRAWTGPGWMGGGGGSAPGRAFGAPASRLAGVVGLGEAQGAHIWEGRCARRPPGSLCQLPVTLAFEILPRSPLLESGPGRVAAGGERKTLGTPFQSPFRKSVWAPSAPPPAWPGPRCIMGFLEVPSQGATLDRTGTCGGTPATSATSSGAQRDGPEGCPEAMGPPTAVSAV